MTKQEQAKRWLDIIYPENIEVEVNPVYLKGHTKSDILECFSHFRNYMILLFTQIAKGEINFPSRLHCILAVMSTIVNSSKLKDEFLSVDKKVLKSRLRKPPKADKDAVINLMKDTGFYFDDDIFSAKGESCTIEFPDDSFILKGMYFYCITQDFVPNQGMMYYGYADNVYFLLNPRLFEYTNENRITFILDDFFRFIDKEEEKDAVEIFHAKMLEYGFNVEFKVDIFKTGIYEPVEGDVGICYSKNNKPTAIVGVYFNERTPCIGIKINEMRTNTSKYSDYVNTCSNEFKNGLNILYPDCSENRCEQGYNAQCKYCIEYTLNKTHYRRCTCLNWGCPQNHKVFKANKNDVDTFLFFIRENDTSKKNTV